MSQPTVAVNSKKYVVAEVSIVLKLNSAPLIYLLLSEDLSGRLSDLQGLKQEFFPYVCQEQKTSFEWDGKKIELILVGFREVSYDDPSKYPSSRIGFELVGTAINKELKEWFNTNPFKDKYKDYLVYQKPTSGSSWSFFNKLSGEGFKQPKQDLVDRFELIFPDYGCIWRYKDSDNLCFLNRLVNYARQHLPEIQGWSAFDNENPFCLILFEEKKQDDSIPKLDQTWTPGSLFLPNRYSRHQEIDYSSVLSYEIAVKGDQKMTLIEQLLTDGSNGENESKGKEFQEKNPIRLLYAPGTIVLGGRNMFCHTVSYQFTKSLTESPSVTIKIEVSYPQYQIGDNQRISLQLSSKFQQWSQTQEGEKIVEIAPLEAEQWAMVDESTQNVDDNRFLAAQILSPTYSDDNHAGVYIKHEKGDEMLVDIQPCEIPLILGSVQKYRKELEEADITLCGEKLAISVSSHNQSLDNSEAIILDNSEIKLNHGKKIFGQAQEKVDFLSQNIELGSSQIEINSGQAKINSLVNVSFPSPKVPTPNVPSSPVVAGLASGEVGGGSDRSAGNDNSSPSTNGATSSGDSNSNNNVNSKGADKEGIVSNGSTRASVVGLSGGGVAGNNKDEAVDQGDYSGSNSEENEMEIAEEVSTITTQSGSQFNVGQASGENNLCLLDSLFQLLTHHLDFPITLEELTSFLVVTNLMQVGPEQDFYNPNITQSIAAEYNITLQPHLRHPDGSITEGAPIGNQGRTLHILHERIGEDTHHFSPLFPSEEAVGDNHETEKKELPAELLGGAVTRKRPRQNYNYFESEEEGSDSPSYEDDGDSGYIPLSEQKKHRANFSKDIRKNVIKNTTPKNKSGLHVCPGPSCGKPLMDSNGEEIKTYYISEKGNKHYRVAADIDHDPPWAGRLEKLKARNATEEDIRKDHDDQTKLRALCHRCNQSHKLENKKVDMEHGYTDNEYESDDPERDQEIWSPYRKNNNDDENPGAGGALIPG